jgi:hypothetical protein
MLRLVVELLVGVNALAGLIGLTWRRRRQRALTHEEYVARLRAENEELDRERERIERGRLRP